MKSDGTKNLKGRSRAIKVVAPPPLLGKPFVSRITDRQNFLNRGENVNAMNSYFRQRAIKLKMSYSYNNTRQKNDLDIYRLYLSKMNKGLATVSDLMFPFDEEVIAGTCAVGIKVPSHTQMDEVGALSLSVDTPIITKSEEMARAILTMSHSDYKRGFKEVGSESLTLSLKRGTNQAWPIIAQGSNRILANFILGINITHAWVLEYLEIPVEQHLTVITKRFGQPFFIPFSRNSHTGKVIPMGISPGVMIESTNFEARSRKVEASPKYITIFNRLVVKVIMDVILKHPWFNPTPEVRHSWFLDKKWDIKSIDHSKFDLRHGKSKLVHAMDILCNMVDMIFDEKYAKLVKPYLRFEALDIPLPQMTSEGILMGKGGSVVSSGESTTTILGCICNFVDVVLIFSDIYKVSYETALKKVVSGEYQAKLYGDDGNIKVPIGMDITKILESQSKRGLSLDVEATTKFLGSYYIEEFKMRPHYSLGRAFQGLFFPERMKEANTLPLAMAARFELMRYEPSDKDRIYKSLRETMVSLVTDPLAKKVVSSLSTSKHTRLDSSGSLAPGVLLSSPQMVDRVMTLPESRKGLDKLALDIAQNPDQYGLGNSVGSLDSILNLFTHGLTGMESVKFFGGTDQTEFLEILEEGVTFEYSKESITSGRIWEVLDPSASREYKHFEATIGAQVKKIRDISSSRDSLGIRLMAYEAFIDEVNLILTALRTKKVLSGGQGPEPYYT